MRDGKDEKRQVETEKRATHIYSIVHQPDGRQWFYFPALYLKTSGQLTLYGQNM